jgi:hypothetical protein
VALPVLGGLPPRPLRDFWAVHHRLRSRFHEIGGDLIGNPPGVVDASPWERTSQWRADHEPDRFACGVGYREPVECVLDLELLDAGENPTVASWTSFDHTIGDHEQFWDWLDNRAAHIVLI